MKFEKESVIRIIYVILAILIGIIIYFVFLQDLNLRNINLNEISEGFQEKKLSALCLIMSLYILKPLMPFLSTSIQLIFTALIFPFYLAIFINTVGMTAQMFSGYFMGSFLGKDFMEKSLQKSKSAKKLSDKYLKGNVNTIFITHLVPIFPFDVISMYYGAVGSKLIKYVLISMLGLAPRILAFTMFGASVFDPTSPQFIISVLLIVGITTLAVFLFNKHNKDNKNIDSNEEGIEIK